LEVEIPMSNPTLRVSSKVKPIRINNIWVSVSASVDGQIGDARPVVRVGFEGIEGWAGGLAALADGIVGPLEKVLHELEVIRAAVVQCAKSISAPGEEGGPQ
jgi:hypothetical protein